MFAELPAEVQRQARRAYRIFRENPNHTSLRFKPVHPRGQSTLFGSVLIIERWEFYKVTKSCGTGSVHIITNFFHNRCVDPNHLGGEMKRSRHSDAKPKNPSETFYTLNSSPAALIPSMARGSSSSAVPPLTPTAPMISSPLVINTPPATGTILPSDITDKAFRKEGRSFNRSLSERLDSPIPTAPQALPMAICGRRMLAPSSRFNALRHPPSSKTTTHMGLNLDSLAFANALSAMIAAFSKVKVMIPPMNVQRAGSGACPYMS